MVLLIGNGYPLGLIKKQLMDNEHCCTVQQLQQSNKPSVLILGFMHIGLLFRMEVPFCGNLTERTPTSVQKLKINTQLVFGNDLVVPR